MPLPLPPLVIADQALVTHAALEAIERLRTTYRAAEEILEQDENDPARLSAFLARLQQQVLPLIPHIERIGCMTEQWIRDISNAMGSLLPELREALEGAKLTYAACASIMGSN